MPKIWILTINQVASDPQHGMISSNYRAPRSERKVEYYASPEGAQKRQREIYEGMKKLVGFFENVEAVISEKEVLS
jgi:hypothetical protein